MLLKPVLILISSLLLATASASADRIVVGDFSSSNLDSWETQEFAGETEYRFEERDGKTVLLATSDGSASGLGRRKLDIDLNATPFLNWSWRVDQGLANAIDETTKAGDDYAARVYVVKSARLIWNTRALNYVWSGNQSQDTVWKNAYRPKNAVMIAARGADSEQGVWYHEKRNIKEDFEKAFGRSIDKIEGVAIMTDTDNSGQSAVAAYGDIFFSAD